MLGRAFAGQPEIFKPTSNNYGLLWRIYKSRCNSDCKSTVISNTFFYIIWEMADVGVRTHNVPCGSHALYALN